MNSFFRAVVISSILAVAALGQAQSSIVKFQSGNGNGVQDSLIYTKRGDTTGPFGKLKESDFSPTLSGEKAYSFGTSANWNKLAGGWLPNGGLGNGSTARWVGVDPDGAYGTNSHSALYAISFTLDYTANATLNFKFTADDGIGDAVNEGLFMDGKAIAGTKAVGPLWNSKVASFSNLDLGLLSAGTHTLYMNVQNYGNGPSGIMFEGSVTQATSTPVPEPASMAILGLGLAGLLKRRRNA